MKKSLWVGLLPMVLVLLAGCNVVDGGKNHEPVFKTFPTDVSVHEKTKQTFQVECKDPEGIPITYAIESNNTAFVASISPDGNMTLDASKISLGTGKFLTVRVQVTCSDGENNVIKTFSAVVQNVVQDSWYTLTRFDLPKSIVEGEAYNATLVGEDRDGVPTVAYTVTNGDEGNATLKSDYMTCALKAMDSNQSTCSASISGLPVGDHFSFNYTISPKVDGANPQSDLNGSQAFQVHPADQAP